MDLISRVYYMCAVIVFRYCMKQIFIAGKRQGIPFKIVILIRLQRQSRAYTVYVDLRKSIEKSIYYFSLNFLFYKTLLTRNNIILPSTAISIIVSIRKSSRTITVTLR